MRIAVTGANGFVGRNLVRHLLSLGHEVIAMVRQCASVVPAEGLATDIESANHELTQASGSLQDRAFVAAQFDGCDAVIHLAAKRSSVSEGELVAVNTSLTGSLVKLAAEANVGRFVYLSCLPAAHPEPPTTRRGARSTRLSRFAQSKRRGEEKVLALAGDLAVTVVRAPLICGPGDAGNVDMFRRMKRRVVALPARGKDALSVIFIDDVCAALALVIARDHASGSVFELDAGTPVTWHSFTTTVAKTLGVHVRPVGVPYWMFSLANRSPTVTRRPHPAPLMQTGKEWRSRDWTCSSDDIAQTLGWRANTSPLDGIARTAQWYRDAGWL